ncbi:MAG TPA: phosphate/phosphite/phosphonate ABC transporter substrate-binding protein [Myxococcota bacterium]
MSARIVIVIGIALALAASASASCTPAEPGLGAFEGGFDPTRYDGGTLPEPDAASLGRPLRFDVPPFYAERIAEGASSALEHYLEKETHLDVEIRSPSAYDYSAISDALAHGDVDVAELSPYQYALIEGRGIGVIPLAATVAHGASTYGSYLVVKYGSPIHGAADMRGKRIAFVDPLSTSGFLLPALWLKERGIDIDKDVTTTFAGSHPAALAAVLEGRADVAAVSSDLLIGNAGLAGPLVVVGKAGRSPYDIIVARKDLDAKIVAVVRRALYRLSIHDEGAREALRAFSSVDGFMPVPIGHYDGVLALAKKAASLSPRPAPAPAPAPARAP